MRDYYVIPQEPNYQPFIFSEEEKKRVKGAPESLRWVVFIVTFFVIFAPVGAFLQYLGGDINSFGPYVFVAAVGIAIGVTYLTNLSFRKQNIQKMEQEKSVAMYYEEVNRLKNNAQSLTLDLTRNYNLSTEHAAKLPKLIEKAVSLIKEAEEEYAANAFAPFWDAVEKAAITLGDFNDVAKNITESANEYYRNLAGQNHTFPTFPVKLQSIPDASPVVERLRRVVRLGQTNFQFANIWEHRKTRKVMIAGFGSLNEAIYNLGDTIEHSISSLQQSISSDIANLVEAQIKTYEAINKNHESLNQQVLEQNRMLDNIQHNRPPK
jgi:hypothetical protein